MKYHFNLYIKNLGLALIAATSFIVSCNKRLPDPVPIITPLPTGNTIADLLNSDTSYSMLKVAVRRAGLLTALGDRLSLFTVFAPNNAAFRLSGIADTNVVNALPLAQVSGIAQYHVIPGQAFGSSAFAMLPNLQEPTSLVLSAPFFRMSIFPSARGSVSWVNNLPITVTDIRLANGIVHQLSAVAVPPSLVLAQIIYADADLTYFTAAVARADSGQSGTNRIDSLLKYPPVSMTVLAPNNAAFQTFLDTNIRRALIAQIVPPVTPASLAIAAATATSLASSPTVFSNPALYSSIPAAAVRALLVYHLPATLQGGVYTPTRFFSVNFPTTFTAQTTMVNSLLATHPGIMAQATFAGNFAIDLKFKGVGTLPTGGAPFSGPVVNTLSRDRHAVNGTTFTIDRVLLPQ